MTASSPDGDRATTGVDAGSGGATSGAGSGPAARPAGTTDHEGVPPAAGATGGVPLLVYPARVRVLCVGGGPVAARKVGSLMDGGARVRVVAPEVVAGLRAAADSGRVSWDARTYRRGDIGDAHLVFAATAHAAVNAAVAADADAAGRLCVRVDDAADGSAAVMGAVRRDPVVLAVATSGVAPGLSWVLRRELEQRYGREMGEFAELWGQLRADPRVVAALAGLDEQTRRRRWRALYRSDILGSIRAGNPVEAKEAALACLLSSSD